MSAINGLSRTASDPISIGPTAIDGALVVRSVYDFLGRFVAYPSQHAHVAHALWCVHAHLMDRWDSTPRLAFLSPEPQSGKSRALELTSLLVPNPVSTVNVSTAYLFRKIGEPPGATVQFDEIDSVFGPKAKENEELRGLLNAGHRRGQTVGRCITRGKEIETVDTPAYSAVALAGLGWLPDTIMSRSIIIRMRRRHDGEHIEEFRSRRQGAEGARVKALIEVWAAGQPSQINDEDWPDMPAGIRDRDADCWESLLVVADLAGGDWPRRAREAAVALVAANKEVEPSLGIKLLSDIRDIFSGHNDLSSRALIQELINLSEAPWASLRGKPLDERGLSQRLRSHGIKSKNIRTTIGVLKGYSKVDFIDTWKRYLPQSPENAVTSATSATARTRSAVADVAGLAGDGGDENKRHKCIHCGERGETVEVGLHHGGIVRLHSGCVGSFSEDA